MARVKVMAKKDSKKDPKKKLTPKVVLRREMEVSRVEEKTIHRADGEDSYKEKATFTDGTGDKVDITMGDLPKGITQGAKLTIQIVSNQSRIEDHA